MDLLQVKLAALVAGAQVYNAAYSMKESHPEFYRAFPAIW